MPEKLRLYIDRKINFQNTFYTHCINITIDSFSLSIIFRCETTSTNLCSSYALKSNVKVTIFEYDKEPTAPRGRDNEQLQPTYISDIIAKLDRMPIRCI